MGWTCGQLDGPFSARAAIAFDLGEEFARRVLATARYGTVIYAAVRSTDGKEVFGLVLLAERQGGELGDHHFQQAVDEFRAGDKALSSSRIKHRINAVRSMSRWAIQRRKIPTPLAVEVQLPADDSKPRDRIATPGEFAHLLDQLEPEDALPWALAGYGTARTQEVEVLDWPEVDFKHDVMLLAADDAAKKSEAARRILPLVR
jgi:integrase